MFRTVPLFIISCFSLYIQQNFVIYTTAVFTVKTADDGHRNCPKHIELYSKNKFENLRFIGPCIIVIVEE